MNSNAAFSTEKFGFKLKDSEGTVDLNFSKKITECGQSFVEQKEMASEVVQNLKTIVKNAREKAKNDLDHHH